MGNRGYRRRKILVDKSLQVGIALRVVLWLVTYLLLFCLMSITAPLLTALVTEGESFLFTAAMGELLTFGKRLLIPLGLTFLALALHCTLMLHRIAGPAYRFKMMLRGAGNGDLVSHMKLRDGDFMTDVADVFNDMVSSYREDVGQLKEHCDALLARAQKGHDDETTEIAETMQKLLDGYKTAPDAPPVVMPLSEVAESSKKTPAAQPK
ncbi:MAG: hypothetical protein ACYS99_07540 [Planctomycetota bacterium]|jgi:methyl-accepting chemotaxis protein